MQYVLSVAAGPEAAEAAGAVVLCAEPVGPETMTASTNAPAATLNTAREATR